MNRDGIIKTIKSIDDIANLSKDTRYINIDIVNPNKDVIDYFKTNGKDYLYAESINDVNGYIYVSYDTFIKSEEIIEKIISNIPSNLNKIEISKYIYTKIGSIIGYDINSMYEKNDNFTFSKISTINNVWGAIYESKATNQAYTKIYMYLCSLLDIDCEIITINDEGDVANKLYIDNNNLIVNLTKDIPYIEAKFKTRYFSNYNDIISLDKKINYIYEEYNDIKLDKLLKNIDYNTDFLLHFLSIVSSTLNIDNINPIELGIILKYLFDKYCSIYDIEINNLYISDICDIRRHFILISYNDEYYSYNYKLKNFMKIKKEDLIKKIDEEKIGIYLNENLSLVN